MASQGPSPEALGHVAEMMWRFSLEQAEKECPEYRFYLPFAAGHHRVLPSELYGVAEYPSSSHPKLPAVHHSYFAWPKRDTFSYTTAPISANEVVERVAMELECEEQEDEAGRKASAIRWRHVTLRAGERRLCDGWDMSYEDQPFEKPWPPRCAQVIEERAREAVQIDDGRTEEDWLALQPANQRERLQQLREDPKRPRDVVAEILNARLRSSWELYRFLGAELYEGLTASYREPLAAALFAAADGEERAAMQAEFLRERGRRLRAARADMGQTVERVAALTGLAKSRLRGAERGRDALKVSDLLALAELYRLSPQQLLAVPGGDSDDDRAS